MSIDTYTSRSLTRVFDRYASGEEEYGFTRTIVPVFLATYGDENLVSRSQARRLVARFDRFKEVVLDFENVSSIGQAFADELFRVFVMEHPGITLGWIRAATEVKTMIARAGGDVSDSRRQLRLL
jgi:hypothetical protein